MENKGLSINLKKTNINEIMNNYLLERKINGHNFYGIMAYLKGILDSNISDPKLRDNILKDLNVHVTEHFWSGIHFAKNNPEKVEIEYKDIGKTKKKNEEEQRDVSYFG